MNFYKKISQPLFALLMAMIIVALPFDTSAEEFTLPLQIHSLTSTEFVEIIQNNTHFQNGDFFWITRYQFLANSEQPFVKSFDIPGNEIEIRFTTVLDGIKRWVTTDETGEIDKSTLFISTDKQHMILSVPGVYERQEDYGVINVAEELEEPVQITKHDGFFNIRIEFPHDENYIAEAWGLQSAYSLFEWDERTEERFMSHELADDRRLSMEGYYFQTPDGYTPGGAGVLFRHPSSYTGVSFSRYSGSNAEAELGYVIMKLSAASQNDYGFYPIPCESGWLIKDFGIGEGYYDTRWNSDFATGLIDAYRSYGDPEFLERAKKYAEFYMDFAENNSYSTGKGILVQDYWHEDGNSPTHASLNHHLAELNVMLRLFNVTQDERYRELAERMLLGVEETEKEWLLPDGNLAYALHYNGTANVMVDYPFLTYNDLYTTRTLLRDILHKTSDPLKRLMDSKLKWMEENGVTGYWK